ncbi:hypothetical protein X975_16208, partial [Stegodyphus mimosarum]
MIKAFPFKMTCKLTSIFNACMHLNYFPHAWNHANIFLIPKPGKSLDNLRR